jgi:hypothetical protein
MLNNDTKEDLKNASDAINETLKAEQAKLSKDTMKSPIVLGILIFLVIVVSQHPLLIMVLLLVLGFTIVGKSVAPTPIGKIVYKVPRDMIQNRKQLKEEAMKKASELKQSITTKKDE